MAFARRVFISAPRAAYLDERRERLKLAIVAEIEARGFEAQMFGTAEGGRGSLVEGSWSHDQAERVMHRCVGAAMIGFPVWTCSGRTGEGGLVSEYCHYEGALARTMGLPVLALLEDGALERGIFNRYGGAPIGTIPRDADADWATSAACRRFLDGWQRRVDERADVFLGYSSRAEAVAAAIGAFLRDKLGLRVRDWREFAPGNSILQAIEQAEARCTGGIFLLTADDALDADAARAYTAVPRDNVVFEAGYFARGKGKDRALIIRQDTAKLPADLDADIYVPFSDGTDLSFVKKRIRDFVDGQL